MSHSLFGSCRALLIATLAALAGGTAQGQEKNDQDANGAAAAPVLEEVLITAQKRQESAQSVGLSIAALSAEQIDAMNAGSAKELMNHISGVLVNDNFGAYSSYVI